MIEEMRGLVLALALTGHVCLVGCAHTTETHESSTTVMSVPPPSREVIAVDQQAPPEPEAPRARPRLTQTVTLGQGNGDPTYSSAPPPPQQGQGGGQTTNVTVNNNVVVNQPPVMYGGYGGYGYGGYGYGGAAGYGRGFSRGSGGGMWGGNGFEGARRTAPSGGTPGVGGNWPSAPSYGPAQMK